MARPPRPWYRADRGRWFVTVRGVRHDLGPDEHEAHRRFYRLLDGEVRPGDIPAPPVGSSPDVPFSDLLAAYLEHQAGRVAPSTLVTTRKYLSLLPGHARPVALWGAIEARPTWGPQTRLLVARMVRALFRWAGRPDPLAGAPLPAPRARGAGVLATPEQLQALYAACSLRLAEAVWALRETGARPGELLAVTAGHLDRTARAWVLPVHKSARKTGRPRVIYLSEAALGLSCQRAGERPTGPLFVSATGRPWANADALSKAFRRARRKAGLPEGLILYSARHTFASDLLAAGVSDAQVAALLGHADTRLVHTTYGHLGERGRDLRAALGRAPSPPPMPPAQGPQSIGRPLPAADFFGRGETI